MNLQGAHKIWACRRRWDALDFFLRHPQPRTIALRVSPCDVKSGALSDDARDETCEGHTSFV